MHWFDKERCVAIAEYVIETKDTVRAAALHFGVSKSTVHKDVTQTLRSVNRGLYLEVGELLQKNKQERHLRGGEATRLKYERIGK